MPTETTAWAPPEADTSTDWTPPEASETPPEAPNRRNLPMIGHPAMSDLPAFPPDQQIAAAKVAPMAHYQPTQLESLFSGLDSVDQYLTPDQRVAFQRLDKTAPDSGEVRAKAINQIFVHGQMSDVPAEALERNWEGFKKAYASEKLKPWGFLTSKTSTEPISDREFYDAVGKSGIAGMTLPPDVYQTYVADFRKPFVELPSAPNGLPDMPIAGISNPALVGGVYNGLRPLLEGLETKEGVLTLGLAGELKAASEAYPYAKAALMSMSALFAGIMGKQAIDAAPHVRATLADPKASTQDKVEVVTNEAATSVAAVLGALGVAFEAMPKEKVKPLVKRMEGKDPGQVAQVLKREAAMPDATPYSDFLIDASRELEKIAPAEPVGKPESIVAAAVKTPEGEIRQGAAHAAIAVEGEKGFTTSDGRFVDREEAMQIAKETEQAIPEEIAGKTDLHSHMLDMPAKAVPEVPTDLMSIKNAVIDRELKEMGLPGAEHGESITAKETLGKAMEQMTKDPNSGARLVEELFHKLRPVTAEEDALLTVEMNRLRIERNAAEQEMVDAIRNGDRDAESGAHFRIAKARDDFARAADVATVVGTKNAQGLAMRRLMVKEDYSLAAMERRRLVANRGKPLTEDQTAQIRDMAQRLADAQKAFDQYRAQQEYRAALAEQARESVRGKDVPPTESAMPKAQKLPINRVRAFLDEQGKAARERLQKRMTSGRVSSGIDPADLADFAIIGADYIAKGAVRFADWSAAMLKEFGETVRPHLMQIYEKAVENRQDAIRLGAFKTRTAKAIEVGKEKLATGDFSTPPRRAIPLDAEALKLKADLERVKREVRLAEMKAEMENRTPAKKVQDALAQWVRVGALSWPTVLAKLTGAALIRTVTTPIEQAVGYGLSKALPELAARAPREGVPELRGALRAEVKAVVEGLTTGIKGSAQMLKNKDTDLSALMEREHLPPGLADWLGKLHGALKNPTKINEYARSLELRMQHAARNGIDPHDPIQQLRLMHEAYMDANRSIFLQDNGVVDAYRRSINALEHVDPKKYDATHRAAMQLLATGMKIELPIVKVPTNVIAEASQIMTGWLTGPARAAWVYAKGIEGLNPVEADAIMRLMKKGLIGLALTAIGFFKAKQVGGFYERGEKRPESDVQPGDVKVGGKTVPGQLLHNPYISGALDFGATLRRASESRFSKRDIEAKGIGAGLLAASLGLIEETPFLRETTTIGKYTDTRQVKAAVQQKAASILIPGTVQWLAAQFDKVHPFDFTETPTSRKPTTFTEQLKKDIPGLRQEVPKRNPRQRNRR